MPSLPKQLGSVIRVQNRSSDHVSVAWAAPGAAATSFSPLRCHEATQVSCGLHASIELCITVNEVILQTTVKRRWYSSRGRGKAPRCRMLALKGAVDPPVSAFASYNAERQELDIVLLTLPPRASWLASVPSHHSLADLVLPGTHETLAQYGWPISACQTSQSVKFQLERGLRFVDLRFALMTSGILRAYHGIQNEHVPAADVFREIYDFLDAHPTETLICSIKQENAVREFQAAVLQLIDLHLDRWWLEDRMPTLAEARGKVILFSRFGNVGIKPTNWPNNSSEPFEWQLEELRVWTQDWYDCGTVLQIPEKFSKVKQLLSIPEAPDRPAWRLDFASAASPALGAMPSFMARGFGLPYCGLGIRGVNARLFDWLVDRLVAAAEGHVPPVRRATVLLDFFESPGDALVPLLLGLNFWPPSAAEARIDEKGYYTSS